MSHLNPFPRIKGMRLALAASVAALTAGTAAAGENWPTWRGTLGTGVSPESQPPLKWSETENIRWKASIPGHGSASPIVWGDRVYLLTAIPDEESAPEPEADEGRRGDARSQREEMPSTEYSFAVLAVDREDGSIVWESEACRAVPHEGRHPTASFASASALTDGEHLYAYFGSRGLSAFTLEGDKVWEVDLGDMSTRNSFGEGSSPALLGDRLVVVWDHEGDSFLVALDKATGKELWRTPREERTTWATPVLVETEDGAQVITNGTTVRGYDLETGKLLWHLEGMTSNPIPTPIHVDGTVFVTTGYRGNAMKAIRLAGARGDLAGSEAVLWSHDEDTPYVPTPLYLDGILYFLKSNSGMISAVDAATGKALYSSQRLELANIYASPIGAAGRVYVTDLEGATIVLQAGPEFKELARNELEDGCQGSLAMADDEIYLRGNTHLYCIAEG